MLHAHCTADVGQFPVIAEVKQEKTETEAAFTTGLLPTQSDKAVVTSLATKLECECGPPRGMSLMLSTSPC